MFHKLVLPLKIESLNRCLSATHCYSRMALSLIATLIATAIRSVNMCRGGSKGSVQGVRTPPPPPPEMTCVFLIQLVFCKNKKKICGLVTSQLRHSLVVHPLLKKILGPPQMCSVAHCFRYAHHDYLAKTLLGIDSNVTLLQLLQSARFPFLGIWTMLPCVHSRGIS